MEYVYAAMLLHTAGKEINEASIEAVVKAAGVTVDKAKAKSLVEALKDVNIDQAIKEASAAQVVAAPVAAASTAKAEAPKEEKKVSAEEAAEGLGSLFG